jgi:integrase
LLDPISCDKSELVQPIALMLGQNRLPLVTGATGHLASPKKAWARVLKRAGIKDLRIHDLRRSLGSWQARTGASLTIIGKSLHHKSHQSTAVYARLDLDPVRESMERATSAILVAAGAKSDADVSTLKAKSQRRRT